MVFTQMASEAQLSVLVAHSSTSLQAVPVPENPGLHAHEKLPRVLEQVAFAAQSSVLATHSSMSLQVVPLPVNPGRQVQS